MAMKYVRFDDIGFVVWPRTDAIWHSHIGKFGRPISAGFVRFFNGTAECYGRSESLGIGGLPDDAEAICLQFGLALPKTQAA